jgi:DNA-binding NarL/FixJ family response regulator
MRRVLVAASQPLAAYSLEASLSEADDFQVVQTINSLSGVGAVTAETPADILLLGLDATPSPPDLVRQLKDRQPELTVIAVGPDDPEVIESIFELGADGYHVHPAEDDGLAPGLRQILLATAFRSVTESEIAAT